MEKGVFERVADICVDSEENVIVNWFPEITEDEMAQILKKALESIVKYKVLW